MSRLELQKRVPLGLHADLAQIDRVPVIQGRRVLAGLAVQQQTILETGHQPRVVRSTLLVIVFVVFLVLVFILLVLVPKVSVSQRQSTVLTREYVVREFSFLS